MSPIRFGSWIGGDRDGNPSVTSDVTRRACLVARRAAAMLYLQEIDQLHGELSLSDGTEDLRARAGTRPNPIAPSCTTSGPACTSTRDGSRLCLAADGDLERPAGAFEHVDEFAEPLRLCYRSLHATGNGIVANGRLLDVLRRVAAFGLTLVRLDVRQEANRIRRLSAPSRGSGPGCIYRLAGSGSRRLPRSRAGCRATCRSRDLTPDAEVAEVLATFRHRPRSRPSRSAPTSSRWRSAPSDVLAVEFLQRCGRRRPGRCASCRSSRRRAILALRAA